MQASWQIEEFHTETDRALSRRLELLSLVLGSRGEHHNPWVSDHSTCDALSASFRGKLCQQLAGLQSRHIEPGQHLYRTGNPAHSLFLVRTGLIKTCTVSANAEARSRAG